MCVRVSALGLIAVTILALPACSTANSEAEPGTSSLDRTGSPSVSEPSEAPMSSAALRTRLLDERDLGNGYTPVPKRPSQLDDVTVLGCPALKDLDGEAATGGSLDFPRQAKVTFTYTADSGSEVSEALYSDTVDKLSEGTARIFDAMTSCPDYQVFVGGTAIEVTTQKMTAPQLGDEQWSQVLTFSASGRDTVVKQTAIRDGSVLLIISGSPALVDRHLDKALAKAIAVR